MLNLQLIAYQEMRGNWKEPLRILMKSRYDIASEFV